MKKMTKIVSLLLIAVTLLGLTACSNAPDFTVDETLQKGYAMLDPAGETTKNFTLTINQGEKYAYTFSGRISDGSILSSLTVSRNGLKSNYKNMFLTNNGKLYINLNGAMSASESEIGFKWTDTSAMQNRYLTVDKGYTMGKDLFNTLKNTVFSEWSTKRASTENSKGSHQYNLTYSGEALKSMLNSFITQSATNTETLTKQINANIQTLTDASFDTFKTSMHYYQDKIDIDTETITGEYETHGTHFCNLLQQELTALSNLLTADGAYVTENISYSDKEGAESFTHIISFCDKDGTAFGKITLEVSQANVEKIDPSIYNYLTMEDFIGSMNTNIKNAKGVGYETNDFPYVATYTASQLTLTETNDLYKAMHVFNFERSAVVDYTVTFYTYDMYIHNALANKYNSMNMRFVASDTDKLVDGTGSGVLQYTDDAVAGKYEASDPIELLKLLESLGVPTYGD